MVTILPKFKKDAMTSTQIREEYYAYVTVKGALRTESKNNTLFPLIGTSSLNTPIHVTLACSKQCSDGVYFFN